MSAFSGKLSPVMTNSEDPAVEDQSTAISTPMPATTPMPASTPIASGTAPREVGGREGLDPTRFGDWELRGRCIDF
jgi:hypothetical protein